MKPLVSILIPAFNAQKWIGWTLESACAQTWQNTEIVVVDDGSTDATFAVAQRFASASVKVVTQPNQGAAAARNKALSLSQGDYIQWLDADDLLAPDKIATHMHALSCCPSRRTLLSSAWGRFYYCASRSVFSPSALWFDLTPVEWLIRKMGMNLHMQPATWLVSRDVTESAGPWDDRLTLDDDGEYFCRVLLACDGTHFVPEARSYYRMSGFSSLSNVGCSGRKLESQFLSMSLHVRYLRSLEDSARTRAACVRYLRNWLIYFYPQRPDLVEQLGQLAASCGAQLGTPCLPWKYDWIRRLVGWNAAKYAWLLLPMLKTTLVRTVDLAHTDRLSGAPFPMRKLQP